MKETDLAYAAGLIDGEGSIAIAKQKVKSPYVEYRYRLLVQIGMCDATAPMWMYLIFGGSCKGYDRSEVAYKKVYRWQLADRRAGEFLLLLLPHLKTKKMQAEIAIEFLRERGRQSFPRGGNKRGMRKPQVLIDAEAILAEKVHRLNTFAAADDA